MRPQPIGIIGGAGPLAGVAMLGRLFDLSSKLYGCYRDADFPKVFFLSFPFSEMLSKERDEAKLRKELKSCLKVLRKNGASVLAIACNTLHAFLDKDASDLIRLPEVIVEAIPPEEVPLVLCTTTSAVCGVHKHLFPCVYPDPETQRKVDEIIAKVLKGYPLPDLENEFLAIIKAQESTTIVLGCTELSLFKLDLPNKTIIDPVEIAAKKLLERSYQICQQ